MLFSTVDRLQDNHGITVTVNAIILGVYSAAMITCGICTNQHCGCG